MNDQTTCWIITEGMAGTENQCLGVAEALGITPKVIKIELRSPWKQLSPWLKFESDKCFKNTDIKAPWPDLVLASGRKSIAAARYIKKQSNGQTLCVYIQDPRIGTDIFDLIAVPKHDALRGNNVIVTDGAPNRITKTKLETAQKELQPSIVSLPTPRVAVLIGGRSKTHDIPSSLCTDIKEQLIQLADSGHGIMLTASRRTGPGNEAILKTLADHKNIYYWEGQGENPYFQFLANADFIIVTSDSVSMISDAATTGKPVYTINLPGKSNKFDAFYTNLRNKNIIRDFNGDLAFYTYEPLNDAMAIANAIKKHM